MYSLWERACHLSIISLKQKYANDNGNIICIGMRFPYVMTYTMMGKSQAIGIKEWADVTQNGHGTLGKRNKRERKRNVRLRINPDKDWVEEMKSQNQGRDYYWPKCGIHGDR